MSRSTINTFVATLGTLALSACVPPAPEPTPVPTPQPPVAQPSSAPPTIVTPTYDNWMDAPQSAGNWTYVAEPGETLAVFGTSRAPSGVELIIRCDLATRRVGIGRKGSAPGQVAMLVRTETQDRTLTASTVQSEAPLLVAQLAATDNLLDAMAFSRGRIAIEAPNTQPLFAPAWPEITRVVEDCRG